MDLKFSFAPIQGVTDYVFRNVFNKHFGGVDNYYAPYLRIDKEKLFKKSKLKDVLPENNLSIPLIPQIMTNNSEDFIYMANYLFDLGYPEINWNLGCPYPMVTNRQLGAGLLPHHNLICDILEVVIPKISAKLSIKLRTGLTDEKDLEEILPMLDPFPLTKLIIHPRYAKQLYKEQVNLELFIAYMKLTKHNLCYNGDITSAEIFNNYFTELKTISRFMIGRGVVSNPFLINEIRKNDSINSSSKKALFKNFHADLYNAYIEKLSDKNHVLSRMKAMWIYFSELFIENRKVNKKIKKSTSLNKYNNAIDEIFREFEFKNYS